MNSLTKASILGSEPELEHLGLNLWDILIFAQPLFSHEDTGVNVCRSNDSFLFINL